MLISNLLYFFTGENIVKKDSYIDRLKSRLKINAQSMDCDTYHGDDVQFCDVMQSLQSPPFLASHRLIILKNIDKLREPDRKNLLLYIKNPRKTSVLLLTTKKDVFLKDKFSTALEKYCRVINFALSGSSNQNRQAVFGLMDEISFRKRKLAIQTAVRLLGSGKDAHEILGLIAWQIRRLGKTKMLIKNGNTRNEISSLLRLNYNKTAKLIDQAAGFSFEEIKKVQNIIINTDAGIKKSISTPEIMLEMLIARLSSPL